MTAPDRTRKRSDEVLAALIGGMSTRKVAAHLGLGQSTVDRISRENRALIDAARTEQSRRVAEELQDRALYAARRLEDVLDSPNDTVVIAAIRTALSESLRWAEQVAVLERLAALEERAGLRVVS